MDRSQLESATGELFSGLWSSYDAALFEESAALFTRRLPLTSFSGLRSKASACSMRAAAAAANHRNGTPRGPQGMRDRCGGGIANARQRAAELSNVEFKVGSILSVPYPDATFDLVWCAGVLMITDDENQALNEDSAEARRQALPSGLSTGGMRWPHRVCVLLRST